VQLSRAAFFVDAPGERADRLSQDAVKHDRLQVMRLKLSQQRPSRRMPNILLVEQPDDKIGV